MIESRGEYDFGQSGMRAAAGFAALRAGELHPSVSAEETVDTQRDFWMQFGRGTTGNHAHPDGLNLGIEAFGLNLAPDLGYPEAADGSDKYHNWSRNTPAHNTVQVNNVKQSGIEKNGFPMHFDDAGMVKLMDVDAPNAYPNVTSIFRRTLVMVDIDDTVSYGVDFFRVKGGNDHLYAFHALSDEIAETGNLEFVSQPMGSYAGPDVPWGTAGSTSGYAWFKNVRRAAEPGTGEFFVDFRIKDFRNTLPTQRELHLRMTMLNGFDLSEVALTTGIPAQYYSNPKSLEFVFARRSGANLDSLFTTVFEPYDTQSAIASIEAVGMTPTGGAEPGANDAARAVKVTLKSGRKDYIVYASNREVRYTVDGSFEFQGFAGVYMEKDGDCAYAYLNDGSRIGELAGSGAYTGTVTDFTRELAFENQITIRPEQRVEPERLAGQFVFIENDGKENAAYRIESAQALADGNVRLHLGNQTLIRACADAMDLEAGYVYNIEAGSRLRIPLSAFADSGPVWTPIESRRVAAGTKLQFHVQAESPAGRSLTYSARSLPRGVSLDPTTGAVSWTPDSSQIGDQVLAIDVSDGVFTKTQYVRIQVYQRTGSGSVSAPGGPGQQEDTQKPGEEGKPPVPGENESESRPRFDDLSGVPWAVEAIDGLAEEGIIKGVGPRRFAPGANITRADFAVLLTRLFGLTGPGGERFADVPQDAYYAEELAIARAHGIVQGVGDNRFLPGEEISREDMMLMLRRALDAMEYSLQPAEPSALDHFTDAAQVSEYARDSVAELVHNGVIQGADGRLSPQGRTTRAETAVTLWRVWNTWIHSEQE